MTLGIILLTGANSMSVEGKSDSVQLTIPSVTPSPTSIPGAIHLIAPEENAKLPQPNEELWRFSYNGRGGPCNGFLIIKHPDGTETQLGPQQRQALYEFSYAQEEPVPSNQLDNWQWGGAITCPEGSVQSELRDFSVEPAPTDTPTPTGTPTPVPTLTPLPVFQVFLPAVSS